MATEGSVSAIARWEDTSVAFKDFKGSKHPVPNIVKIIKGQYRNIGVSKAVHSELYLHSIKTCPKLLAEAIKIKDGKKVVPLEHKFSLPITYQGWFEVLSEDGKAVKPIQSVGELFRIFPQTCLVRENIKAYLGKENHEISMDKTRVVYTGEQLTLVGDFSPTLFKGKKKFLRCFDMKGSSVYLPFEQKGSFCPIAGHGNISGVHNVQGLVEKFRFPILVRLVHGIIPGRLDKNSFTGMFRLLNLYSDETAFVCPLRGDTKMVPVSTREPLKFVTASNFNTIQETDECKQLHKKCSRMIASYLNSIHILIALPDPATMARTKEEHRKTHKGGTTNPTEPPKKDEPKSMREIEDDILFQEIEVIYRYVREGGVPPPDKPRPSPKALAQLQQVPPPENPQQATGKGQHEIGHYWEEPIYEQIDKFRTRAKEKEKKKKFKSSKKGPVQNLRQVIKDNNPLAKPKEPERAEDDLSSQPTDSTPPPVPPKNFDSTEDLKEITQSNEDLKLRGSPLGQGSPMRQSPVNMSLGSPKTNNVFVAGKVSMLPMKTGHAIFSPSTSSQNEINVLTRQHTAPASSQPLGTAMISTGWQGNSFTEATAHHSPKHPHYVAVAHVGDHLASSSSDSSDSFHDKYNRPKSPNYAKPQPQQQAMYL